MSQTPLDAPMGFTPAEDERPAGTWMETYWADIARWAKFLSYAIGGFFLWTCYQEFKSHTAIMILFFIPAAVLGYFCYRFAQNLEQALAHGDQLLLEKAFQQLRPILILALILATFWLYDSIVDWMLALETVSTHVH